MNYENKKVLIVEDDDMNRMLAGFSFNEFGIEPEEAANGKEAYDIYIEKTEGYYDLIMMDMLMPVMDGKESTQLIRGSSRSDSSSIPIVAMTAESDQNEIKGFAKFGITDYIEKPMEMENLQIILEKYLK